MRVLPDDKQEWEVCLRMSDLEIYNLRQDIRELRVELDAVKQRLRELERIRVVIEQ